jgi:hypothetical protein
MATPRIALCFAECEPQQSCSHSLTGETIVAKNGPCSLLSMHGQRLSLACRRRDKWRE